MNTPKIPVHTVTELTTVPAKRISEGEYVKLNKSGQVYIMGKYCPMEKKYGLIKVSDIWGKQTYVKAERTLFIGFGY